METKELSEALAVLKDASAEDLLASIGTVCAMYASKKEEVKPSPEPVDDGEWPKVVGLKSGEILFVYRTDADGDYWADGRYVEAATHHLSFRLNNGNVILRYPGAAAFLAKNYRKDGQLAEYPRVFPLDDHSKATRVYRLGARKGDLYNGDGKRLGETCCDLAGAISIYTELTGEAKQQKLRELGCDAQGNYVGKAEEKKARVLRLKRGTDSSHLRWVLRTMADCDFWAGGELSATGISICNNDLTVTEELPDAEAATWLTEHGYDREGNRLPKPVKQETPAAPAVPDTEWAQAIAEAKAAAHGETETASHYYVHNAETCGIPACPECWTKLRESSWRMKRSLESLITFDAKRGGK